MRTMSSSERGDGGGETVQSRSPWPGHFLQCFPFLRSSRQESAQRERVPLVASEDPAEACRDTASPLVVDATELESSVGMSTEAQLEFANPLPAQRFM